VLSQANEQRTSLPRLKPPNFFPPAALVALYDRGGVDRVTPAGRHTRCAASRTFRYRAGHRMTPSLVSELPSHLRRSTTNSTSDTTTPRTSWTPSTRYANLDRSGVEAPICTGMCGEQRRAVPTAHSDTKSCCPASSGAHCRRSPSASSATSSPDAGEHSIFVVNLLAQCAYVRRDVQRCWVEHGDVKRESDTL